MVEHVDRWLETLGLGKYAALFSENEITVDVLPELAEADLKELGLPLGPRKLILKAIGELVDAPAEITPYIVGTVAAMPMSAAERRQLTVMFVDLVGSTALSARLDPEEMGAVLRGYQNAVAGEVARFDGHVAKFMGDGVLAYFGWPRAHEDEAERAVRAALAVRDAVSRLAGGNGPLECRIGIATGVVVVGELIGEGTAQEQTVVGETPNLAARLQALAAPGQVVVGEATRRLLGAGFLLGDLGVQALKGIEGAVSAFAISGERVLVSRFEGRAKGLQPMVGRDQELALLLERWAQAAAGEGQAVLLVGEAGVGKSRISRALLDALGPEPHTRIRYQCSPYHTGSALWPAIQQLEHAARFAPGDPLETRLGKLEAALGGGSHGETTALIAGLVGLDGSARYGALEMTPAVRRARTLEALVRQLLQLAAARPVLLLIEDAHWADPTTLELIEAWLDAIATARVLMVLTSRPDSQPTLAAHPHVTRLSLNRLGRAGVEAIVARLGGDRLPQATVDAIIARTDGVPLYVEELTKAVLETGEAAIPASLHDSLMARLDRIPEVKEVAQIAACIGRAFDYRLLAAVAAQPEPEVCDALERLAAAELIFRRGTPPEAHYTFKHALVRDAAYASMLNSKRRALHERIAETLEARFPERVEREPSVLAQHYAESGDSARALGYWSDAGRRAAARWANLEAIEHLSRALNTLSELPETPARRRQELELLLVLGPAQFAIYGYGAVEVARSYTRAEALCEELAELSHLPGILQALRVHHMVRPDLEAAIRLGERLIKIGRDRASETFSLQGLLGVGIPLCWLANFRSALEHLEKARSLAVKQPEMSLEGLPVGDPGVLAGAYAAKVWWLLGHHKKAATISEQAILRARQLAHPFSLGQALGIELFSSVMGRRNESVKSCADELMAIAEAHSFPLWRTLACTARGWAAVATDREEEGLADLRAALAAVDSFGFGLLRVWVMARLAESLIRLGSFAEAGVLLNDASALVDTTHLRLHAADLARLEGELLLHRPETDRDAAAACFGEAVSIAHAQSARSLELRAARDLARLWADQGKRQQARDLLAPVYGWFTEDLGTPDLVEAKTLLDELL